MTVGIRTSAGREPAALPAGEVLEALYVGVSAILLLQLGFVYLPFMNALFGSALLGAGAWFLSFLVALIVLPVIGAEKMWRKRVHRRKPRG